VDGTTIGAPGPTPEAEPAVREPLRSRWLWVGVVAAVVVGVALVAAIVLTARTEALPGSGFAAGGAPAGADGASAALAQLIEDGSALAASTTANQLADPVAHAELLGALVTAGQALEGSAQQIESSRQAVAAAMDRVTRSLNAKALADAQSELSAVLGTAVQVNASAAGRVADDAVRVELQARVDAGWALLGGSATIVAVAQQTQAIADQTAVVLDARFMGFREADGKWCTTGGRSCLTLAWPAATLANGDRVELAGGENAVDGSGCYLTDQFAVGRDKQALLFCPAGEAVPDRMRASALSGDDQDRDRLWLVDGSRLSDLRYRA